MAQYYQHKIIIIDKRADKELKKFPKAVQLKFESAFEILEKTGYLDEPIAKKLIGKNNLFEIRIIYKGQWRSVYAYREKNLIVILSAFQKKTQKTPLLEIERARRRLLDYES